ncbi:MAG: phosphoadenosine phosphosulfate reductase family protein [Aquaticitalea sp.]
MIDLDLKELNKILRTKTPDEIIEWTIRLSDECIVTTSFGIYSAVLLSTITRHVKDMKVIWCDTLFNQPTTYEHASKLIKQYRLNIHRYQSLKSKEEIDATIGLPSLEDDNFEAFSELVKVEPFRRALREHQPEIWFTNIRERQTELRSKKDILSYSKDSILKVSPFYYWTDADLDAYVVAHNLVKNDEYFDPVKALQNRECGIHLQ